MNVHDAPLHDRNLVFAEICGGLESYFHLLE